MIHSNTIHAYYIVQKLGILVYIQRGRGRGKQNFVGYRQGWVKKEPYYSTWTDVNLRD